MIEILTRGVQIACLTVVISLSQCFCSLDSELESAYRITFTNDIGYTLIGAKPISISELQDLYLQTHPDVCQRFIASLKATFKDSDKFIFKVFAFDEGGYQIELIHRKALRDLVSKSAELKKYIEAKFSSLDEFFSYIEEGETSITEFNSIMRGILFGYGKGNAQHYLRIGELGCHLKKRPYVTLFGLYLSRYNIVIEPNFPETIDLPYMAHVPDLSIGFDSLESEWEYIKAVDVDISTETEAIPPYFINLPFYVCRQSAESDTLRDKYIRARSKLAELFLDKSYQQAVNDQVCRL